MAMVSKKLYIACDLLWLALLILSYLRRVLTTIYCQITVKENKQPNKGGWYQPCCVLPCQKCKACALKNSKKKKKKMGVTIVQVGYMLWLWVTLGAVRWLEGKEREGSVIGDSQRWYVQEVSSEPGKRVQYRVVMDSQLDKEQNLDGLKYTCEKIW